MSMYKINGTLHGCLWIRILSSCAESISHSFASLTRERYFQHSKIKFVSPRGHVISSIYHCFHTEANSNYNNFLPNLSSDYCITGDIILTLIKLNS